MARRRRSVAACRNGCLPPRIQPQEFINKNTARFQLCRRVFPVSGSQADIVAQDQFCPFGLVCLEIGANQFEHGKSLPVTDCVGKAGCVVGLVGALVGDGDEPRAARQDVAVVALVMRPAPIVFFT